MMIRQILELPPDIESLVQESEVEGYKFVHRLVDDWQSDENRFNRAGEFLLGHFEAEKLLAVGGVNIDPYLDDKTTGRIRHLYVHPKVRRTGVARALMATLLTRASLSFNRLRLRTSTVEAGLFYETIGFQATREAMATHVIQL